MNVMGNEDLDKQRSVAVVRHMVYNASCLENDKWQYSVPFFVQGLTWCIGIRITNEAHTPSRVMGLYLCPQSSTTAVGLVCYIEAKLTIVTQLEGQQSVTKELNTCINVADSKPIGFDKFRFWNDVIKQRTGFLRNNNIVIEAYIAATPPQQNLCMDLKGATALDFKRNANIQCMEGRLAGLTLAERAQSLLDSGLGHDCEFVVGNGETKRTFRAARVFLARASPVFERMFYGDLNEMSPITLQDVEADVFQLMLQYVYDCKWKLLSYEQAVNLFKLADRYWMSELKDMCIDYIWPTTVNNLWDAFELATFYDLQSLKAAAVQIVRKQTREVFDSADFLGISQRTLITILQQNNLNVSSEIEVFRAAMCWATAQCREKGLPEDGMNQRLQLGDALKYVRFLTMSITEFVDVPSLSGILTLEEALACVRAIVNKDKFLPCTTLCPLRTIRYDLYVSDSDLD